MKTLLSDPKYMIHFHLRFSKTMRIDEHSEARIRLCIGSLCIRCKNDYPWGTIRDDQDTKRVVCRCLNTKCSHFHSCRPDFDPAELDIHEENKRAQPAIFEFEEAARKKRTSEDGDARAAAKLFAGNTLKRRIPAKQVLLFLW